MLTHQLATSAYSSCENNSVCLCCVLVLITHSLNRLMKVSIYIIVMSKALKYMQNMRISQLFYNAMLITSGNNKTIIIIMVRFRDYDYIFFFFNGNYYLIMNLLSEHYVW